MAFAAAAQSGASSNALDHKSRGNAAFSRRDYHTAVEHYTAALASVGSGDDAMHSDGGQASDVRVPLLTNRALVLHRLGSYAAAAADAEEALALDPNNAKAAFRAAAARLAAGDGAAAARHAALVMLLCPAGSSCEAPAGWGAIAQHAAALAAHQQRVQEAASGSAEGQQGSEVLALLQALAAEAEGEDADIAGGPVVLLRQLTALLRRTCSAGGGSTAAEGPASDAACAAAALCAAPGQQGWRLLLFYLADADPACREAAAEALQAAAHAAAAGGPAVLWPAEVWTRLVAAATAPASSSAAGGTMQVAAMGLLRWAATEDGWVRQQLLLHPLVAPASGQAHGSPEPAPIASIVGMLSEVGRRQGTAPATVKSAAQLLRLYASDPAALQGLASTGCQPLSALVRATTAAESMAVFQQEEATPAEGTEAAGPGIGGGSAGAALAGSSSSGSGNGMSSTMDPEQQALVALRQKRKAVYDAELVDLRRALLAALADLAASAELAGPGRELLLSEAVAYGVKRGTGSGGGVSGGKRKVVAGPLVLELLGLVRHLHEQQPRRTTPVLGPDGAPRAYIKRRFAADYKDNPAGDYLLHMDLKDGPSGAADMSGGSLAAGSSASSGRAQHAQRTLLELALDCVLRAAHAGATVAALLYRRDVFALCDGLAAYCSPAVVAAAQRLCAAVADAVPAAAEELLSAGTSAGNSDTAAHRSNGNSSSASPAASTAGSGAVAALAGLFLYSTSTQLKEAALGKLAAAVDTCSGDDFALLTGLAPGAGSGLGTSGSAADASSVARGSAVFRAWELAGKGSSLDGCRAGSSAGATGGGTLQAEARRFLLRCLERAQRQQQLGTAAVPRGGAWNAIGRQPLLALLQQGRREAAGVAAGEGAQKERAFETLKRGFFAKAPASAPAGQAAAAASPAAAPGRAAAAAGTPASAAVQPTRGQGAHEPRAEPSSTASSSSSSRRSAGVSYKQGAVLIEELVDEPPAAAVPSPAAAHGPSQAGKAPALQSQGGGVQAPPPAQEPGQHARQEGVASGQDLERLHQLMRGDEEAQEEEEVADLADVFDSSTRLSPEQRRARAAWLSKPLDEKLKWTQTSTDVSATLALPAGTRASDVQVSVSTGHLTVSLVWFGRVLNGRLHRPVKPGDTHWCLEGEELHLLLAKADGSWWKALVEGGQEKSYYDILKEAVHADEPVQAYDQLDDSAKGLIESFQERQAYINTGVIDPEGFDDFRVVIGENSLGGAQRTGGSG